MTTTETLIKATIIEANAAEALARCNLPGVTGLGESALRHMAEGMISAVSVLTGEPMAAIRTRIQLAARDRATGDDTGHLHLRAV